MNPAADFSRTASDASLVKGCKSQCHTTIKKQTNSETSSCFSFYFFLVSNDIITTQINTKRSLKPRVDTLNLKTMQCFRILQSTKIKCVKKKSMADSGFVKSVKRNTVFYVENS